jgi:non-heme chloroperoxidase
MGALARLFLFAIAATLCRPVSADTESYWPGEQASRYFTTSDGIRLHYIEAGIGETLLFVPGWLMPGEIWRHQIDYFARQYRVIAFDPRSQGESEIAQSGNAIRRRAEDLHELIEHLQANRVVLIGWSLGVMESLLYMRTHGDAKIAALVLVDNSLGEAPGQEGGKILPYRGPNERDLAIGDFVHAIFNSTQPAEYLDWLTRQALRTPPAAGASLLSIPFPRSYWRSAVYATRKPVLYAVTAGLGKQADTLRRKRKATSTEVFNDAGHALFVDEPARFNAALESFLEAALKS